jgi:hypothetical protein
LTPTDAASSKLRVFGLAAQAGDWHGDQLGMGPVAGKANVAARAIYSILHG